MNTTGLHSVLVGEAGPYVVFLHGLFGQGKNWTSIAKALADSYRVLLVDLPNHGRSAWTERVSYPEVASTVGELIDARRAEDGSSAPVAVVGHSMGGKVAMTLALLRPALVERLCVVDVSPVRYSTLSSFAEFLRGMRQLDLDRLPDRMAADEALTPYVPDSTVRSFLLQNLRRQPVSAAGPGSSAAAWRWQLNIELIDDQLGELGDWPTELSGPYLGPTLWVAGGDSRYVLPEYGPIMRELFPRAQLVTVKKAGHWVHSDQPEVFSAILRRFLRDSPASPDSPEDAG
ncbi:MAG TPA: alpha/beta fold hydrolase [Propionibacteriaceae bacterium]|nr:alpha/beta fold hydrolase [Propionibacteriaceae bacterium]